MGHAALLASRLGGNGQAQPRVGHLVSPPVFLLGLLSAGQRGTSSLSEHLCGQAWFLMFLREKRRWERPLLCFHLWQINCSPDDGCSCARRDEVGKGAG